MAEIEPRIDAVGAVDLVLASASPFRRKLLEAAGVAFRVVPAKVDEAAIKRGQGAGLRPAVLAETLAVAKAEAVSRERWLGMGRWCGERRRARA